MGGVDSRHFITHLGGHKVVASLITLSSPHRGSPYGEWCVKAAGYNLSGAPVQAINDLMGKLPDSFLSKLKLKGNNNGNTDTVKRILEFDASLEKLVLQRLPFEMKAHHNTTRKFMTEVFNPQTLDHPDVAYYSFAGAKKISPVHPLYFPSLIVTNAEGDNDGMVSVESAKWGKFIRTLPRDHAELINWGTSYDARRLYRRIANFLAEHGF
eukprot:TRINITY_DN7536_c0_g1_i1.p1 TRINITY_DN7536_c0_g1~~TRINITY_DN7536_c0_g1_i1.p1  ORF type:complete len:211 (-),score=38.20 TRINITY_DN7536_c0_g1_i1:40-672(-)